MPPHPLSNFELEMYYQNEPRFNGVFSRNNLPKKIKDEVYLINLDEYADVAHIELLNFVTGMKLFISIVSVLNMFSKEVRYWE